MTPYLNVMRPGKEIPPHDHTVLACIAAVDGAEQNRIHQRVDDGSIKGEVRLDQRDEVNLRPGRRLR